MAKLGSNDNHPVDADDDNGEDDVVLDDFNQIDVSGGVGTIANGELFPPIDDAADIDLLVDNADAVEPLVAVSPAVPL